MRDNRPLLATMVNPGVPWWVALPCNIIGGVALVLLICNPAANLTIIHLHVGGL